MHMVTSALDSSWKVGTSMEKMKAHDGVKRYENSGDDETSATMGATG
ncbi:hypothetical protein PI125_g254 [Phytophthora idaei]|nr:hypothetical protein PI125_g254 [Phytophthora idaei]